MELLLLSNSRTAGGFLTDYLPAIAELAGGIQSALFVPFAAVTRTWDEYAAVVKEALAARNMDVKSLHETDDPVEAIESAALIIVGGGNTFNLLHHCRKRGLLGPIAKRVRAGAKYLGWSAGANLACPTIKTTNDMPVIDPGGLEALGLIAFQINPHYTNALPAGHQGETRDQRLLEYARVNPAVPVVGLPEGDWLRVSGARIELRGPHDAAWFSSKGQESVKPGHVWH